MKIKGQSFTAPGFHGLCHVFSLFTVCSLPSFTVLFKVLWSTVLACTDLCCRVVCCSILNHFMRWKQRRRDTERKKQRASDGGRGRDRGKESLQGKWMVGMRVEAQWMSCTLGWGVLEVLCWGSRGHSGCDWHQNNISWQTTLVKGRGQASTRRPHLEYQQPFLFMVNSVWLALVGFFLTFLFFAWNNSRNVPCGDGAMPPGLWKMPPKTPMYDSEIHVYSLLVFLHSWKVGQLAVGGGVSLLSNLTYYKNSFNICK